MSCNPECPLRELIVGRLEAEKSSKLAEIAIKSELVDIAEQAAAEMLMDEQTAPGEDFEELDKSILKSQSFIFTQEAHSERNVLAAERNDTVIAAIDAGKVLTDEDAACPRAASKVRSGWRAKKPKPCENPERIARAITLGLLHD